MPRILWFTAAALVLVSFTAHAAAPVVESVTTVVGGTVDARTVSVTFTFSDADGDACYIALFGRYTASPTNYASYPMRTFAEGDIYGRTFTPGTHTVTWLASQDRELSAPPLSSSNFKVYMQVSDTGRIAAGRFCVIDVSGGRSATSYPVEYKSYVDVSLDVYKTDKIVLRELPDGSWAGVYEITQRQYERVTGATPSYFGGNPKRPVETVSWDDITGTGGYGSGFIKLLRDKAGLTTLDLPSSAAWEYACRASTTYDFNDYTQNRGKGASDIVGNDSVTLGRLGWYYLNSGSATHDAGGKQPNAWGLYDMHGNVYEWCTTLYSGSLRVIRGGYWDDYASSCASGLVHYINPDDSSNSFIGFRLALPAVISPPLVIFDQGESAEFALTFSFPGSGDSDGDGLPEYAEAGQGCSPLVADAALYATWVQPSPGAAFGSVSIVLSGRLSSPYITSIVLSTDNGATWDKAATISGLTWSYSWTPSVGVSYIIKLRAFNVFGGYTDMGAPRIYYRPDFPAARISSPINDAHVRETVAVTGTAAGAAGFGLQDWVLDVRPGTDPSAMAGLVELARSSTAVSGGTLCPGWNTDSVAEGVYALKLTVTDASGFVVSRSFVTVNVDRDTTPPAAPSLLAIAGAVQADFVANGNTVNVTGTAEANSYIALAEVLDQTGAVLKDVTGDLTLHLNGSIRGAFTLPMGMTAQTVSLRLRVKDAPGNVSNATTSNTLPVDNAAPTVTIGFPKPDSILPRSLIILSGIAADNGASPSAPMAGLDKVQFSTDGSTWADATGTDTWSYNWTPTADGAYTLYVRALDKLGNVGQSSVSVTVNNAYPSAYITSPTQGQVVNEGSTITITGTASDTVAFDFYVLQYARGVSPSSGYTSITGPMRPGVSNGTLGTWDTTGLDEGLFTLRLFAMNGAGNFVRFDMQVRILSRLSLADLPDAVLDEDTTLENFVHLPDPTYCQALSGDPETFTYTITGNTNPNCGVSVDANRNIDIHPVANWNGTSTVTVQVSNGTLTNDDVFTVTVNPVNDVPTAPVVGITPADPLAADILTCQIVTPSSDPDVATNGQIISYGYAWYASTNLTQVIGTSTTLDASITQPGVSYTCVVTPSDGVVNGPTGQATVHVRNASTITAGVQPATLTLGQSTTVSGAISATNGQATAVAFTSTRPGGGTANMPATVNVVGTTYSQAAFYPDRAGAWSLTAQWPGDTMYRGATSAPATFSVDKAQPALTLSLSASSAPLNYKQLTVTATLSASLPSELNSLLAGRTVKLYARKPDGSVLAAISKATGEDARATFLPSDLTGLVFDTPGTWQFRADFEGDGNFLPASSMAYEQPDTPRLTIKDRAGYAVLVVGRLASGEGQREHARTADYVYRSLRDRGFAAEDITYLRGTVDGYPVPSDISATTTPTTQGGVASAITQWALGKMTTTPAPLYVLFIDHGSVNAFHVYAGVFDETAVITSEELAGYFSTLEAGIQTAGKPAQDIVFVYGACYSGSFVPALSAPNRLLITSTAAGEVSHRGVETDGIRDGEAFTTEFFRVASSGKTLKECFERASGKIGEYTASSTNRGPSTQTQTPQLDDNGDGASSKDGALSFRPGEDGALAHGLVLGYGVNAAGSASWIAARPTVTLGESETLGQLWALCDERPATGNTAWIEVKTPTYAGGTPVSGDPDAQDAVVLTRFDYESGISDLANGYFRWSQFGTTFDAPGAYKVFYYVKDGTTGEVSTHVLTTVYRQKPANQPPDPVTLAYPADGAETLSTLSFVWEPATDPDGDAITYRLEVSENPAFPAEGLIVKEGIHEFYAQLTSDDGIHDLRTYYWRVISVDQYGAESQGNSVRGFHVNNDNPSVPGCVLGVVKNAKTGAPVSGATVRVGANEIVTSLTGTYYLPLDNGSYSVQVSMSGYVSQSKGASISNGETRSVDFRLEPTAPVLNVTPGLRNVSAGAGTTTFDVTNAGTGTMTWSAQVTSGGTWLRIAAGTTGTDTGAISLGFDANPSGAPRSGAVRVTASGATGSPMDVTVTQAGDSTPVLSVTPSERVVGAAGGQTTFDVSNTGNGTLNWTASVTQGNEWLSVVVAKVTGNGTITATYTTNGSSASRTGTIRIEAPGASGSPVDVTVTQAGDTTPVLSVTPAERQVGAAGGQTTFDVSNAGNGTLNWTASVVQGNEWLAISTSKILGNGTITATYSANASANPRTGVIRVEAPGALGSPVDVTVTQAGQPTRLGDVSGDGKVDAIDIQLVINKALGIDIGVGQDADMNDDGKVNAVDVQIVINRALGIL